MRRNRLILLGALLAVLAATTALASIGPAEPAFPVAAGLGFQRYPDVAAQRHLHRRLGGGRDG